MSYPRHDFATYLVAWDDLLMLKAGVTSHKRWRQFCTRGARLVMLHIAAPEARDYCALESRLGLEMSRHGLQLAFPTRVLAAPVIGGSGGGYSECRVATSEEQFINAQASCSSIMLAHGSGQAGNDVLALMHGRTDGRTYVEPPRRRCESSRSVTREETGE